MSIVLNKVYVTAATNPGEESKDSISLFKKQPACFCTYILTVHFWEVMQHRFKTLLS